MCQLEPRGSFEFHHSRQIELFRHEGGPMPKRGNRMKILVGEEKKRNFGSGWGSGH